MEREVTVTNMDDEPGAYRVKEFCERYSISRSFFYEEVLARRIKITKCGRNTLILKTEAKRWLDKCLN